MKKNIVSLILLSFFFSLYGQVQEIFENEVQISHVSSSSDVHVRANKYIQFRRGFSFDAQSQFELLAEIELKELALAEKNSMQGGPEGDVGALVGTDGLVGAIPGAFNVSPSGASTYTIPIECPPGINGMTPQVALFYNSQVGNGIAGWGWNISGTSAITRVPKNQYYDGIVKAIQWDSTDVFAYNGTRIFKTDFDGTSREYRLENNPKVKIVAYNWTNSGPGYFKGWTDDGKEYLYGSTWNSQMSLEWDRNINSSRTPTDILAWNLAKAIDPFNNFITYLYAVDSTITSNVVQYKNFRIENIEYTSNGIHGPFYKIDFNYISRIDKIESYISLKMSINEKRLSEIKVKDGGTLIKNYAPGYSTINGYTHLTSIRLEGLNGEEYNKTVFDYDTESIISTSTTPISENTADYQKDTDAIIPGDFNGDGIMDYCIRYKVEDGDEYEFYYAFYLRYYSNGNIVTTHEGTHKHGTVIKDGWFGWKGKIYDHLGNNICDYNWDGKADLICLNQNHSWVTFKAFDLQFNELGSHSFEYKGESDSPQEVYVGEDLPFFSVGEVNGDGKTDYIFAISNPIDDQYGTKHRLKLYVSNETGYTLHQPIIKIDDAQMISDFLVSDVNNDGLSDIICYGSSGGSSSYVAYSSGEGNFYSDPIETIHLMLTHRIKALGDFNNDNLIDILMTSGDYLTVGTNAGKHFYWTIDQSIIIDDDNAKEEEDRIYVTDFDSDGFSDIIVADETFNWLNNYVETHWKYYKNNGSGFTHLSSQDVTNTVRTSHFVAGDFFADGLNDEFVHDEDDNEFQIKNNYISNCISDKLISKITTGIGTETNIYYERLIDKDNSSTIYTYDSNTSPYLTLKTPYLALVSTTNNGLSENSYLYHNALLSLQKGYLGIEKVTAKNEDTNIKKVSETTLENNFHTPVLVTTKTYFNENDLLSVSERTFDVDQISDKRYLLKPLTQTSHDSKTGFINSAEMKNHDPYGNPTRIIKKSWNGSTLDLTDSTELSLINNIVNDNWFIGQIARRSVTKIRDETETVITNNYYNSSTGAPYLTYIHKNETNEVKMHYTYDNFGNIENVTTSALNDPTIPSSNRIKTTMNLYSSDGRFPESTINPL